MIKTSTRYIYQLTGKKQMKKYTITTLSYDEIIRTDYCKNKKEVINFLILNTRINSDVVSALHYRVFDDSQNEMAIEIDAKALLVNSLDFVKQFQIVDRLFKAFRAYQKSNRVLIFGTRPTVKVA